MLLDYKLILLVIVCISQILMLVTQVNADTATATANVYVEIITL